MKSAALSLLLPLFMIFCPLLCFVPPVRGEVTGPLLQRELAMARSDEKLPVIVRMKDAPSIQPLAVPFHSKGRLRTQARANLVHALKDRAERSMKSLKDLLVRTGTENPRTLWLINGMAFQATPAQLEEISRRPDVASIVIDQVVKLPEIVPAQVSGSAEPNIEQINAPSLWNLGYAGQGVTVAIMDTGADLNHPDIGPRWRGGSNSWFDPNGVYPSPTDRDGHGTQVTGLVLGGNSSGAYIGVAPEAEWIGVKIFADDGSAQASRIHAGYQWLLDPDGNPATDDAPDIVNNSWGFEASPDSCDDLAREFQPDIQALKAAGIAVVFAAGNTGPYSSGSIAPANYPESFAVGSVGGPGSSTAISDFSARGPSACDGTIYPETVAPGYQVWTSDLTAGGIFPNSYLLVTGTSFSTPHASGVMALLLSAFPDTPVPTLETAIKQSATDLGTIGPDNDYGFGMINALSAFNYLTGQQEIDVTDSISPENDNTVDFGSVTPGDSSNASIKVRNTGSLSLTLGSVEASNVQPPFSISTDSCSGRVLLSGESCSIDLKFAPTVLGSFAGSLDILSNAVGEERVTINLAGIGNTPPVAPQLLAPDDLATVGTSVRFAWLPASDANGDSISQYLVYSPHADFSNSPPPIQVDTVPAAALGAGGGGMLFAGLLAGLVRRRRGLAICLVTAILVLTMVACGGGGSGDDSAPVGDGSDLPAGAQSTTVSGLTSGVTYYWKMVAIDSHGAESQSAIRTFLVQ
jgi:serine protease AprX